MSRKHILHDSVLIYLFIGTAVSVTLILLGMDIESDSPLLTIDNSRNSLAAFAILYVYGLIFGSPISILAALFNYSLSDFSFKKGWHNNFFHSKRTTVIYGVLNGFTIATPFYLIFIIGAQQFVFGMPAIVFLYAPCIVSSVVFCFYRRKNT